MDLSFMMMHVSAMSMKLLCITVTSMNKLKQMYNTRSPDGENGNIAGTTITVHMCVTKHSGQTLPAASTLNYTYRYTGNKTHIDQQSHNHSSSRIKKLETIQVFKSLCKTIINSLNKLQRLQE